MWPSSYDEDNEKRIRKRDLLCIDIAILIVSLVCKCCNAPPMIQQLAWGAFALVLMGLMLMFVICLLDVIIRIMLNNTVLKKFLNFFVKKYFSKKSKGGKGDKKGGD